MMIRRLVAADMLKLRRTMALVLIFLGPVGVVALQAVNFSLRYNYLTELYADDLWQGLLDNTAVLASMAFLLGATLVASLMAGYEHRTNAWKQLLALPVSRFQVFVSKAIVCTILLVVSSTLLTGGVYLLGLLLGFGGQAPLLGIVETGFYPLLGGFAIVTLQLWLSVVFKNQAIPLTVGIVGTMIGMFAFRLPDWVLWKWVIMGAGAESVHTSMLSGVLYGLLLILIGAIHFSRRDVH